MSITRRSVRSMFLVCAAAVLLATSASASSWDLTQLDVPNREPVTLTFRGFDPARTPIDEQWLLESLTDALQAQSRWPLRSDHEPIADLSGLRTRLDPSQSQIILQYVHVDHNQESTEWGQTLTLSVSYQIERSNDDITVLLISPKRAEFAMRKNPMLIFPTPKLWPADKVFADFSNIMDAAQSLRLHHEVHLTGEENSRFRPDSCVANFERLLGRFAFGNATRPDVFSYRVGQVTVPLKITALPYRDGAKILYEASLPFELSADGTGGDYDLPATLQSRIRRILND